MSMKQRCYNTKHKEYHNYGGRGIKICDRWLKPSLEGFMDFMEDMGPRPSPKHSVDRIDTNGNYEPSNCRWATNHIQQRLKQYDLYPIGIF